MLALSYDLLKIGPLDNAVQGWSPGWGLGLSPSEADDFTEIMCEANDRLLILSADKIVQQKISRFLWHMADKSTDYISRLTSFSCQITPLCKLLN